MPCERKHVEAIENMFGWLKRGAALTQQVDETISAALDACDESPWRSMESAPKDGTTMLLFIGRRVSFGGWVSGTSMGADDDGESALSGWWTVDGDDAPSPTHWMPLPAAPEGKP